MRLPKEDANKMAVVVLMANHGTLCAAGLAEPAVNGSIARLSSCLVPLR